jgi:hypothetical protein
MNTPEKPTGRPQYITITPVETTDTAMPLSVTFGPAIVVAYAIVTDHGYHLAADHHDLIAYGTELALALCLIFVGGKLVAGRRFRS